MQPQLQRRMRSCIPRPRHNIRLPNLVRPLPCLGNGQHAPVILPHAAQVQEVLYAVDVRRLEKQVPLLVDYGGVDYHVSYPLHTRAEYGCV